MTCQYYQLCRQRMSAFHICYCYFEQISSLCILSHCPVHTHSAPVFCSMLPDPDSGKLKGVRQSVLFASLQSKLWEVSWSEALELKLGSLHFKTIVSAAARAHINAKLFLLCSSWVGCRKWSVISWLLQADHCLHSLLIDICGFREW